VGTSGGGDLDNSTRIEGGTDGTIIGNVSSAVKSDDCVRTTLLNAVLTVGTTQVEAKVGASTLTNRKYISFRALDSGIFWGASGLTADSTSTGGTELFKNEFLMVPIGVPVYLRATGAGKLIAITESA